MVVLNFIHENSLNFCVWTAVRSTVWSPFRKEIIASYLLKNSTWKITFALLKWACKTTTAQIFCWFLSCFKVREAAQKETDPTPHRHTTKLACRVQAQGYSQLAQVFQACKGSIGIFYCAWDVVVVQFPGERTRESSESMPESQCHCYKQVEEAGELHTRASHFLLSYQKMQSLAAKQHQSLLLHSHMGWWIPERALACS